RDGDDIPDGEPTVLFDGFGHKESRHNLANGFTWGPDGWLYAGHGRTSPPTLALREHLLTGAFIATAVSIGFTRRGWSLKTSPTARPIPGESISTISASASFPTASIRTCFTSSRGGTT